MKKMQYWLETEVLCQRAPKVTQYPAYFSKSIARIPVDVAYLPLLHQRGEDKVVKGARSPTSNKVVRRPAVEICQFFGPKNPCAFIGLAEYKSGRKIGGNDCVRRDLIEKIALSLALRLTYLRASCLCGYLYVLKISYSIYNHS